MSNQSAKEQNDLELEDSQLVNATLAASGPLSAGEDDEPTYEEESILNGYADRVVRATSEPDVFEVSVSEGRVLIYGFNPKEDKLVFTDLDYSGTTEDYINQAKYLKENLSSFQAAFVRGDALGFDIDGDLSNLIGLYQITKEDLLAYPDSVQLRPVAEEVDDEESGSGVTGEETVTDPVEDDASEETVVDGVADDTVSSDVSDEDKTTEDKSETDENGASDDPVDSEETETDNPVGEVDEIDTSDGDSSTTEPDTPVTSGDGETSEGSGDTEVSEYVLVEDTQTNDGSEGDGSSEDTEETSDTDETILSDGEATDTPVIEDVPETSSDDEDEELIAFDDLFNFVNGLGSRLDLGDVFEDNSILNNVLVGTDEVETFSVDAMSSDFGWSQTEEGVHVIWSDDDAFDILHDYDFIQFRDKIVNLKEGSTITRNDASKTDYVFGDEGDDVFRIEGNSDVYFWSRTEDGEGFVTWSESEFNILYDVEEIHFDDQVVSLENTSGTFTDIADRTDYISGTDADNEVFVIDADADEFNISHTEDGEGVLIWTDEKFDILSDIEQVKFNDETVNLADYFA